MAEIGRKPTVPLQRRPYILTRSARGSYIGFSEAAAAKRSPAISIPKEEASRSASLSPRHGT